MVEKCVVGWQDATHEGGRHAPSNFGIMLMRRLLLLVLLSTGWAVAASAQSPVPPTLLDSLALLKPGDQIRLRIYREPELSGDFQVSERGTVVLPRLGELEITTWPIDSIAPRLTRALAVYLRDPTVEVTPLRRVAVIGSVQRPALYPVDPTMSVFDALALAGGASADGVRDRVEVRRSGEQFTAWLDRPSSIADLKLRSGDQLYVPQKSWLSRNTWLVSTLIGATVTFTTIMITR